MSKNKWVRLAVAAVLVVLAVILVGYLLNPRISLSWVEPTATATLPPTATLVATAAPVGAAGEESYYRGGYDICVYLATRLSGLSEKEAKENCLVLMAKAQNNGWYEQPSEGWQWPLPPPPTSVPTATPMLLKPTATPAP